MKTRLTDMQIADKVNLCVPCLEQCLKEHPELEGLDDDFIISVVKDTFSNCGHRFNEMCEGVL